MKSSFQWCYFQSAGEESRGRLHPWSSDNFRWWLVESSVLQ